VREISSRLLRGSLWISASRGLVNLFGFVSTIVLARLLTPDDFGLVAIATTMIAILQSITQLSLSQALVHHSNPTYDHFHAAWTLGFLRGLCLSIAFAAAGPVAGEFYGDPRLENIVYALAISLFLSGLSNPRRIMLTKRLEFWQDFVLNVSQKLVSVLVGIGMAAIYHSYWALVVSIIAGQVVQLLVSYTSMPFRPKFTFRHIKELWSFSVWLSLGEIITTINLRFDQLVVGKYLGRTELGWYTVGSNLSLLPTREATLPLTQALFPAFAMLKDDKERLRRAYQRSQSIVTAVALPLGTGAALIAEPLVLLTMGEKWLPAAFVMQVIAAILAAQTMGNLVDSLSAALGATRMMFTRNAQMLAIRLPIIFAGMYIAGFEGLVWARIFPGVISILVNMLLVKKLIDIPLVEQIGANIRAIVSVALMSVAVWTTSEFFPAGQGEIYLMGKIATLVAVGGVSYLGTTVAIWMLSGRPEGPEREVAVLVKKIRDRRSPLK
jgi:O-antigen/teichoic acid export membrane protein